MAKYTAHLQGDLAGMTCEVEFEVESAAVAGMSPEARDEYLTNRAVDALVESGTIDVWYEEA